MKKTIISLILISFLLFTPVHAQTTEELNQQLNSLLQQLITLLTEQVKILQIQLANLQAQQNQTVAAINQIIPIVIPPITPPPVGQPALPKVELPKLTLTLTPIKYESVSIRVGVEKTWGSYFPWGITPTDPDYIINYQNNERVISFYQLPVFQTNLYSLDEPTEIVVESPIPFKYIELQDRSGRKRMGNIPTQTGNLWMHILNEGKLSDINGRLLLNARFEERPTSTVEMNIKIERIGNKFECLAEKYSSCEFPQFPIVNTLVII